MSAYILLALRILITLSLYGFLGWVMYLLWRDIRERSIKLANNKIPPIKLLAITDKNQPKSFLFTQPEIIIGRDPNCSIWLDNETVSARHARLSFHHNQWWLEDLDSMNGTKLNNLSVSTPTVLTKDDVILCGQVKMIISLLKENPLVTKDSTGKDEAEEI